MGNLGWAEVAVIVVVALVVLGPDKLPQAARQVSQILRQFRKLSTGFRQELQNALDEPLEAEARQRGREVVGSSQHSPQQPDASQNDAPNTAQPQAEVSQPSDPPQPQPVDASEASQPTASQPGEPDESSVINPNNSS